MAAAISRGETVSGPSGTGSQEPRLPACQRCRSKKVKCDERGPKCSACTKSRSACVVVDPFTGENYSRAYIYELEQKYDSLLARAQAIPSTVSTQTVSSHIDDSSPNRGSRNFVGEGSGLNFLRYVLSNPAWASLRATLQDQLVHRPPVPESTAVPTPLPPKSLAVMLVETYLTRSHVHHPFLLRSQVQDSLRRVYSEPSLETNHSQQDLFRLFMIFAISGVTKYREGSIQQHPYGFYLAAQEHLEDTMITGSLDSIQNLLLIARFGMYHHIGTSIWEISRACIRLCVEWNLYAQPHEPMEPIQEQLQRRIFWECYILDRYSSVILGRSFGIADAEITVEMPASLSDEEIHLSVSGPLSSIVTRAPFETNELSVFLFCIHLRQITARIQLTFYRPSPVSSRTVKTYRTSTSVGQIYVDLHRLLDELRDWRTTAPNFAAPRSLYERQEWYNFLLEKEKLSLIRGAMDRAPRPSGLPPRDLTKMCLESASQLIILYAQMFYAKHITWTRSYYQILFTAGLSIMFCLSVEGTGQTQSNDPKQMQMSQQALSSCSHMLLLMGNEMLDAKPFAIVFETLRRSFQLTLPMEDLHHARTENIPEVSQDFNTLVHGPLAGMQQSTSQMSEFALSTSHEASFDYIEYGNLWTGPENDAQAAQEPFFNWSLFTNDVIEHMEAGLGEYAWGNPDTDASIWNQLFVDL